MFSSKRLKIKILQLMNKQTFLTRKSKCGSQWLNVVPRKNLDLIFDDQLLRITIGCKPVLRIRATAVQVLNWMG